MQLCDRPERIMQEMEKARRQENTWTRVEYLWELHPLMEWLNDRNLFRYGRQEAPAIALSEGLNAQEAVFIFFASFPNQWGAPILTALGIRLFSERSLYPHRNPSHYSGKNPVKQTDITQSRQHQPRTSDEFALSSSGSGKNLSATGTPTISIPT
jgi:hypothetical protein